MLLGSVLALAIAFSHYLTFESFAPEKVSTEQTDQAGDESRIFRESGGFPARCRLIFRQA